MNLIDLPFNFQSQDKGVDAFVAFSETVQNIITSVYSDAVTRLDDKASLPGPLIPL